MIGGIYTILGIVNRYGRFDAYRIIDDFHVRGI